MKLEDLKENVYVRTKEERIAKIEYIEEDTAYFDDWLYQQYDGFIDFIKLKNKRATSDVTFFIKYLFFLNL